MRTDSIDKLERLVSSIRLLRKLANINRESALGWMGKAFPDLQRKWLRKANRQERGAVRLSASLRAECDKLKASYQP